MTVAYPDVGGVTESVKRDKSQVEVLGQFLVRSHQFLGEILVNFFLHFLCEESAAAQVMPV